MMRGGAIALVFLAALLLVPLSVAVEVPQFQREVTVEGMAGSEQGFNLLLKSLTEPLSITAEGEAAEWTTFGSNKERTISITNLVSQGLPVTVFIPNGAEKKTYTASIKANGKTISDLKVNVIGSLSSRVDAINADIENLKARLDSILSAQSTTQSGVKEGLESLKSQLESVIEMGKNLESSLKSAQESIGDVKAAQENENGIKKNYEDQISQLKEKISGLEAQVTSLESKNRELTSLTGGIGIAQSGGVAAGIAAGFIIALLISGRLRISRERVPRTYKPSKLPLPKRPAPQPAEPPKPKPEFRYSYRVRKR